MVQLTTESIYNKNLFSNHYLENLVQRNPEWNESDHEEAFRRIKDIWQAELPRLEGRRESQLEEKYFRKIFRILLPNFEVQEVTESQDFPDYAFFPNEDVLKEAHKSKGTQSLYKEAFAVGEVKRWNTELDKFGRDKHNKRRNPSFQIWLYLHETEPRWGVLSNGRKWRLYHEDRPLDCYYEIDLVTLLENNDVEGFRYFYYFFRAGAFLQIGGREAFLERVLRGSLDYARDVGDSLKENVYRAMKRIAEGFFHWSKNQLNPSDQETRLGVQKSSMRLLYRLLFLLYAEGKGLLDLRNETYQKGHSFDRLKKLVKTKKDGPQSDFYDGSTTALWSELRSLFRLINEGSVSYGIDDYVHIPAYNGGLFDPKRNPNLEKWTIADSNLADAIDLLARSKTRAGGLGFVDYSTLEIRHLGSIYEGLLEYKLKIAPNDMVVKGGAKKREWVSVEEFNERRKRMKRFKDFGEFDRVRTGELYLATDKGERKATGSYYTPDYIVNYIVENTIGPIIEEKWREAKAGKGNLVDAILSLKILDPAMGSGHFLVGTVDFMAGKLLEAVQIDIEAEEIPNAERFTSDWAKREIVSHCIYGVDLNDLAVELAKVSLWLETISKDKPLSFLDHRLKQGDSLIGTSLLDLPWYPTRDSDNIRRLDIPKGFIKKLVESVGKISSIDDDTLRNVRKKEEIFNRLRATKEYDMIRTLADLRASISFGNDIDEVTYGRFTGDAYWSSDIQWEERRKRPFAKKARVIAKENSFFHWELEFPEVFFGEGGLKEHPGFDAVIGNPPYFLLQGRDEQEVISKVYPDLFSGSDDISYYFIAKGLDLAADGKYLSYIVTRYWMDSFHSHRIRQRIIDKSSVDSVVDFQNYQVFGEDVNVLAIIVVLSKGSLKEHQRTNLLLLTYDQGLDDRMVSQALEQKAHPFIQAQIELPKDGKETWNLLKQLHRPVFDRISRISQPLGELILMTQGIKSGRDSIFVVDRATIEKHQLEKELLLAVAQGDALRRHELSIREDYLIYTQQSQDIAGFTGIHEYFSTRRGKLEERAESDKLPYWALQRPRDISIVMSKDKILSKRISTENAFVCTSPFEEVIVGLGDINMMVTKPRSPYSPQFLCAVLNSALLDWHHKRNTKLKRAGYYDYSQYNVERIPIRRIHFSSPDSIRKTRLEELLQLYEQGEFDELLERIKSYLPTDGNHNFLVFSKSINNKEALTRRLIDEIPAGSEGLRSSGFDVNENAIEMSDVVHDFLAHLGERVLRMNVLRDEETMNFLRWLEGEMRTEIESLKNRTKVRMYHDMEYRDFSEILKQNRRVLPINPSNREFQENLEKEFDKSLSIVVPLKNEATKADNLIDKIVFILYGLSDEEVGIVEGRVQ